MPTLGERMSYEICELCFWEDDGQDLDALDMASGPNHGLTLRESRDNFLNYGACDRRMVKHVLSSSELEHFEHRPRTI